MRESKRGWLNQREPCGQKPRSNAYMPTIVSELPTTRKLARRLNASAFVGTNRADESITSGLRVIWDLSKGCPTCNDGFRHADLNTFARLFELIGVGEYPSNPDPIRIG